MRVRDLARGLAELCVLAPALLVLVAPTLLRMALARADRWVERHGW